MSNLTDFKPWHKEERDFDGSIYKGTSNNITSRRECIVTIVPGSDAYLFYMWNPGT